MNNFYPTDYHDQLTITATHAIFVKENKKKGLEAPAAVVGYQLLYPAFESYIRTTIEEVKYDDTDNC